MNNFWSWFIKRFFEKMLWGGVGVLIGAVCCFIRGLPQLGIPFLIFGLVCVAGGTVYKILHRDR